MTAATSATVAPTETGSASAGVVAWFARAGAAARASRLAAILLPRLPLVAVLVVTSVLAGRLMMVNTAFADEATYLTAGHVIWHHWLHGGTKVTYSDYFSGTPVIYPVIAAAADAIGGLLAARILSLLFVLVTMCLLYATAVRLFGRRAAGWAVVVFATVAGTQFLAAFATYDAMALMLVALAVWLSIRYAQDDRVIPHAGLLVGAPVLALANATKYASTLYDPVVIAIVGLVIAGRYGWRQGFRCAVMFAAVLAGLLTAAVAIAGSSYVHGILTSTLQRPRGYSTVAQVLDSTGHWVGAVAVLSLLAAAVAVFAARRRDTWGVATVSSIGLIEVLAVAALLAPVEQARIGTVVSLHKHVVFGAWFAAMAVGWLLAQVSGQRLRAWWRWSFALAVVVALGVVGHQQAVTLYDGWPNTTTLMTAMRPYVAANDKPVLMDESDIGLYYLGSDADPYRWESTYYFQYQAPGTGRVLYGAPAYASAIAHNHFGVVALNFESEAYIDQVVQRAIRHNRHYQYQGEVVFRDALGTQHYQVWFDRHAMDVR